jgi:N-alpha-acetyltransferase 38, NatC auxiliary subunit
MTPRYLGLIVVPGKYIVKIEVEEFASQIRGQIPGVARGNSKPLDVET